MDQFRNVMNLTFIMNLEPAASLCLHCRHHSLSFNNGLQSNYDPQSSQNCYSDWKNLENIGELPEFQINNSSEVSPAKLVPGLHIRERLERKLRIILCKIIAHCTETFTFFFANYHSEEYNDHVNEDELAL